MRAFYGKAIRLSLSKPLLYSPSLYRRFIHFFEYSTSFYGTHHRKLSPDDAQILCCLSDHRLQDACNLLNKIPRGEHRNRVVYWTSLLTKYTKFGFVDEARSLFNVIPERNIVTYNAMLTGYVKSGRLNDAWRLFQEMPKNVVSWTVMLCGFCEAGKIDDAKKVFDEMPERNVVSWNSMISGLIENEDLEGARRVFDAMPSRNIISWNAMIFGYTENCRMEDARMLFGMMDEKNVVTWTSMVSGYCRIGDVQEGYELFCLMPERNIVSWSAMIGGFAWNEFYEEALLLFLEMKRTFDIRPNGETFVSLVYACAGVGFPHLGKQVHVQIIVNCWKHVDYDGRLLKSLIHAYASFGLMGFAQSLFNKNTDGCDLQSYNNMIRGYLKIGHLEAAQNLFEEVRHLRDKVSWTSIIDGYLKAGDISIAFDLFHEMSDKDSITWTVMISGLVQNELFPEASFVFSEMLAHGFYPLNSTYSVLLGASGATANLDQGKQLHCIISKTRYEFDLILQNSLISMYAKCGVIDDAYKIFSNMVYTDLVSWNSMIMGFSHHGLDREALELFKRMVKAGTDPNSVTFLGVLSACNHSGLLTRGFELFNAMQNIYRIQPGSEHYICMINLLGRAGKLKEAEEFVLRMPFKPDHTIYGALLGACAICGKDAGVAERASKRMLLCDPLNAPAYVALCNVYARSGLHREEHRLRREMGLKGVRKVAGCSWVMVNGCSHVFLSGGTLPSRVAQMVLPLLCGMTEE